MCKQRVRGQLSGKVRDNVGEYYAALSPPPIVCAAKLLQGMGGSGAVFA